MGRRPVGTGPKRGEGTWARLLAASAPQSIQANENVSSDAGSSGLVSYGSDEEDEEQAETQVDEEGPLPDGWQEVIDQERLVKYYYNTLTEETTWVRPSAPKAAKGKAKKEAKGKAGSEDQSAGAAGKGESQQEVDEDEEARKAALEAEDLFRSLETELLGQQEAEGMDQGAEKGEAKEGAGQDEESLEPMEVSVLSPEELKKLSGAKAKLRTELAALCEAVVDVGRTLRRKDRERRSRLWKLEARLEDWRDGLLPSSSLVRRLRELGQVMEEERRAQEEEEEERRREEAGEEREEPAEPAAVDPPTEAPVEADRPTTPMEEGNGEDGGTEAAVVLEAAAMKGGKATSEATAGAAGSTSAAGEDKAAATPVEWTAVWDPTHNAYYYYNAKTNETTWELPDTMTASAATTGTDKAGKAAKSDGSLPFTDKNTLIAFAGEHPEVTSAEGVSGTFPCSGRREVRELGVNYYCISFETPRATELAICVTNEGMDGDAAVDMAKSAWLRGRAGTFVRYPLPDDEPAKLALVDVGFKTEGAGDKDESGHDAEEQLASVGKRREQEAAALKAPSSAPLLKSGSAVVAGVVAKAPVLRKSVVASRKPQR